MLNLEQGITALKKELNERRLIVFVGSGMSISPPSNLPDWDGFISGFIEHCQHIIELLPHKAKNQYETLIRDAENRKAKDPIKVASVLKDFLRRLDQNNTLNINIEDSFKTWFIETFAGKSYNQNHKLISQINFPYILTSNYDMLIEKALSDSDFKTLALQTYTFTEADSIAASLFSKEFAIIHMHGKYQNVALDNIVFTSEDYTKMLRRSYPGFTMSMQNLFSNYSTLFIGYGGSDPHLEDLLEEHAFYLNYSNSKKLPQNYLVTLKSKTDTIYDIYQHKRRTEIISIDSFDEYNQLLQKLYESYPRQIPLINMNDQNLIL
jgi:hypothetical protein